MGRVLRGEAMPWPEILLPVLVSGLVIVSAVTYVARTLRVAALK